MIDARRQIQDDLDRTLAALREKLAVAVDKDSQRAIKREMRAARADARRLRRTAVW